MGKLRFWLCLGVLVTLTNPALADTDTTSKAKFHFEEGTKAFNLGEFGRAVAEYKAAYNAKPDPAFLYNVAQSYRLAGDLRNSLFFYRSFLRNLPNTPNRREVDGRIRMLEAQIAGEQSVVALPPNTTVPPAASSLPEPRPTAAPVVESPPAPPASIEPVPAATTPALVVRSGPAEKTPVYKKWWLWTVVGVAAAGVAVGVGVGLTAQSGPPNTQLGNTQVTF